MTLGLVCVAFGAVLDVFLQRLFQTVDVVPISDVVIGSYKTEVVLGIVVFTEDVCPHRFWDA